MKQLAWTNSQPIYPGAAAVAILSSWIDPFFPQYSSSLSITEWRQIMALQNRKIACRQKKNRIFAVGLTIERTCVLCDCRTIAA